MTKNDICVIVHLGSTAVHTVVGYCDLHHKKHKIMGLGVANTVAFFGGRVIDRQHLLSAIHKSVREALDMAGVDASHVGLSFASPLMTSSNRLDDRVICGSDGAPRPINPKDLQEIFSHAKLREFGNEHTTIGLCQQYFWVNDSTAKDVVGMTASKLSVAYHLMAIPSLAYTQVRELFVSHDLETYPVLFDGLAGSEYALTADEKKQGVCFVDIGAATTKVCIYRDDVLLYSKCLAMGGDDVTKDIISELRLSESDAEQLKKRSGSALANKVSKSDMLTIPHRSPGSTKSQERLLLAFQLACVIEARYVCLFEQIFDDIAQAGFLDLMNGNMVLAGGGSDIHGILELVGQNFGVNVRKISTNRSVEVCTEHLSNDNIKLLRECIADPKMHSIIGALLYMHSEQYIRDENGQFADTGRLGLLGRFGQWLSPLIGVMKKIM